MSPITALIVEDNPDFRKCINILLTYDPSITVVGETDNGREAIDLALTHQPDIVLMDIHLPRVNGLQAIREITAELPKTRIIALTGSEDAEHIIHILSTGAHAYCAKTDMNQTLLRAIHCAQLGFHMVGEKMMSESTFTTWLKESASQTFMYRGASFQSIFGTPSPALAA